MNILAENGPGFIHSDRDTFVASVLFNLMNVSSTHVNVVIVMVV